MQNDVVETAAELEEPPKLPDIDMKESSSNYSEDDGWGATEDLFEADHAKKAKEAAPTAIVTNKVIETMNAVVQEEKQDSPKIDFFGTEDVMEADNIPDLYPKEDEEP